MFEDTEYTQNDWTDELFSNHLNVRHGFPHDIYTSVSWLMNEWKKQTNKQAKQHETFMHMCKHQ